MEEIEDRDQLYRRLHYSHVLRDGRVNRTAFTLNNQPEREISVDLARLTTPEETATRGRAPRGVGVLEAGYPRSIGFTIRHNPLKGGRGEYAHCLIEGENDMTKCRLLAEATTVLIPPPAKVIGT